MDAEAQPKFEQARKLAAEIPPISSEWLELLVSSYNFYVGRRFMRPLHSAMFKIYVVRFKSNSFFMRTF